MVLLAARISPVTELRAASLDDDAELVRRARGKDRWAEEALYRRHVRTVTNVATRLLGRTADGDDVVQDAFLTALVRLEELSDGGAFRPWIQRITVNLCHRRFRRRRLLAAFGLDRGTDDATLEAHAVEGCQPEAVRELRELDEILKCLSMEARSAWILHRVEGWTLDETSAAMGLSLATTKRRLSDADTLIERRRGGR